MSIKKDLIFDVGMHRGEDAAFYLAKKFRVVGVEASDDLCADARRRLDQHVQTGDLQIENVAVTTTHGPVQLYISSNPVWNTVSHGWVDRNTKLGSQTVEIKEVPGTPFQSLLEKYGVPYYLKIDIEGADTLCLQALKDFPEKPVFVSVEAEKVNFEDLDKELDLLESLGYDRFLAVPQHKNGKRKLRTRARDGSIIHWTFEPGSSGAFGADLRGRWLSRAQVRRRYRLIFLRYRLVGDAGLLTQGTRKQRGLTRLIVKIPQAIAYLTFGRAGWYDTHACHHSSVDSRD